ncbi:MAG: histidine phosphatase family protein [Dehalococcoidia bacterium]
MNLYLIRHGETAYNRDGVGFGRSDVPLTDLGRRQAEATGRRLEGAAVEAVYSSPLQRARATADLLAAAAHREVLVDERLIELEVGETEGLPFTELRERYPDLLRRWAGPDGHNVRLPGGESIADLYGRVADFMESLTHSEAKKIAIVSHNFVLRVMLCHLIGLPISEFRRVSVDLSSLSIFDWTPERTFVRTINDRCHLDGLDS